MRRFFVGLFVAVLVVIGAGQTSHANPNNFIIKSYDIKMHLSRDAEKRSTLETTETIVADFPPNQNRGITRQFVKNYNQHPTSFRLISVKDEHGKDLEYNWNEDQLRVGNKDEYVSGLKTYVIKYTQRDITRFYEDTKKEEFYWDPIGTSTVAPVEKSTLKLEVDQSIAGQVETDLQCYKGAFGANNKCLPVQQGDVYSLEVGSLAPNGGVTISLGFVPGTFEPYKMSWWEMFVAGWMVIQGAMIAIGGAVLTVVILAYRRVTGRIKELKPITPEYIPPKDASVTMSGSIMATYSMLRGSVESAQLLDLAVRHFIKIYEVSAKTLTKPAEYEVEVVGDVSQLRPEEQELLIDMFDGLPEVGQKLNLKKLREDTGYTKRTMDNYKKFNSLAKDEYKFFELNKDHSKKFKGYAKIILVFAIITLSPILLIIALVTWAMSKGQSLTDQGLALRRHLEGLKMYIGVAEQERLKMFQSPEGVSKLAEAGVGSTDDKRQLLKLYERVLPYAVMFGQEKEWSKQLGKYYEQVGQSPDWYSGADAFSAAAFATSMGSLASSTSSFDSYSSSSGGSSGGGSVGGGGGGGGVGGW